MAEKAKTAVALGCFDGLHMGHKSVIACALSKKECGLVPTVLLFDSHPLLTLTGKAPDEILQPVLRDKLLSDLGIESKTVSFPAIHNESPRTFFDSVIIGFLNAGAVCCGSNYRFGINGSGDKTVLEELCREAGIDFDCVDLVEYNGEPISSTRIRNAITAGNIEDANNMLGYEFSYIAEVKSGSKRGRLLDAPTINQYFDSNFIIPRTGVYASVTHINDTAYPSVTNIGYRPTFENADFRSETYIIGYDGDLYGKQIKVSLIHYIRDEIRFDSEKELKSRIRKDAAESAELFDRKGKNQCSQTGMNLNRNV